MNIEKLKEPEENVANVNFGNVKVGSTVTKSDFNLISKELHYTLINVAI
jgi:hypothetical protein